MIMTDIERAKTFLQGVATGDPDLATRHVDPDRYVEHDPLVADGAVELWRHVDGLPKDNDLEVVRLLQDGAFVVTQAQGDVLGRAVFFEVFRFEDGMIVEHWVFSAEGAPPNRSGHTQADGPTEPRHLEQTEMNKRIVRDYYEIVHLGGRHDEARRWFAGDLMIRHEPEVADGVGEFLHDLEVLTRDRTIDEIRLFAGQGDLVFLAAQGTHGGEPCAYIDLYRVEGGKIVEHWGFPQSFPAAEGRKNDNDLL